MKYGAKVVQLKRRPPYSDLRTVVITSDDGVKKTEHCRPTYTMTEAAQTAQWLTERSRGYPMNPDLGRLYNGRETF